MNPEDQILDIPEQPERRHHVEQYDRIGGWLVLVAIGLIASPFRLGYSLLVELLPALDAETWGYLTDPSSPVYHVLWKPLIILELVGNALFLIFAVVLLYYFFSRKKELPRLIIIFYAANLLFILLDFYLASQIPMVAEIDNNDTYREIGRSVVSCAIWTPYFLLSERVKGTFIK